jgi:hypothetical protein
MQCYIHILFSMFIPEILEQLQVTLLTEMHPLSILGTQISLIFEGRHADALCYGVIGTQCPLS